jgi:site-specific recombinase XerC
VSPVAVVRFFSESRLRPPDSLMPYRNEGMSEENHGAAGVKQQLAAVRMMFNWLITGQIAPVNPAAAVRGPKLVV